MLSIEENRFSSLAKSFSCWKQCALHIRECVDVEFFSIEKRIERIAWFENIISIREKYFWFFDVNCIEMREKSIRPLHRNQMHNWRFDGSHSLRINLSYILITVICFFISCSIRWFQPHFIHSVVVIVHMLFQCSSRSLSDDNFLLNRARMNTCIQFFGVDGAVVVLVNNVQNDGEHVTQSSQSRQIEITNSLN